LSLVLITGGLGFIGSHICLEILENGFDVLVIDSLINSSLSVIDKIKLTLVKTKPIKRGQFFFRKGDIRDFQFLNNVFNEFQKSNKQIESVIHLAGLKSISDSFDFPIKYWDFNVNGSINLFKTMKKYNCRNIVFSSSASIYKSKHEGKIKEDYELMPIHPYGKTKLTIEKILSDLFNSEKNLWRIINLRYFNPAGAHPHGLLGENSLVSNNLFPKIFESLENKMEYFYIFGNNWPTRDGTCIRDFIHVMDLAEAHFLALKFLISNKSQIINLNIGSGNGSTVLEIVNIFKNEMKLNIKYKFVDRRKGDNPYLVADNSLAKKILNWSPKKNLIDISKDAWNFNKKIKL
tara:strand:+ start:756 stop:1799 length:1044 start_codon:yes stop_codon:yes gene_type:complete